MGNFIHTQNSFSAGEISSEFFARNDINGLSKLENMDVIASGAISRRRGLAPVAKIDKTSRIIAFSVAEDESYLLSISGGDIQIFKDERRIQSLFAPWTPEDLPRIQYAQRFGQMIFVHPNYQPQVLKKVGNRFEMSVFGFARSDDMRVFIPFMRFDDAANVKISVSMANGYSNNFATLSSDREFWTADNVGGQLQLIDRQWTVHEYLNPYTVIASTNGSWTTPSTPISDWREAAFSKRRGWPTSISFHQNRLVFGGSRDWPSGVWMSKVGVHDNFDTGTGLDDEAIFLTLLSEQRQQICTVVSSDNLQILTSDGEWAISSKPLTPSSINIRQHTAVGSFAGRHLPPQKIGAATVFISSSARDLREMVLDELGENYSANDLCALSKHLMNMPVDMAYNDTTAQLFIVMAGGEIAVLNKNAALGISAWGVYKTHGDFKSVAVMDGETFVIVLRDGEYYIEKFSENASNDGGQYDFSFTAAGLPVMSGKHGPHKIKLRKISARVLNTKSLFINGLRAPLPNDIYSESDPGYSGDVSINTLGTVADTMKPMWKISGSEQLPTTVLSITMNGWYLI